MYSPIPTESLNPSYFGVIRLGCYKNTMQKDPDFEVVLSKSQKKKIKKKARDDDSAITHHTGSKGSLSARDQCKSSIGMLEV